MKKGVAKKSVTKKATKSVKKTNTKKLPEKKGGKTTEITLLGNEVGPSSTAHVLFTQATLNGTTLRIPAQAYQCRDLPRPDLITFDYQVEFNGVNFGLARVIQASPIRPYEGSIEVDINGPIPYPFDGSLVDTLTVTVLTKKKVYPPPRFTVDGEVRSVSCDSRAGTAKKRVTRTKKKSKK